MIFFPFIAFLLFPLFVDNFPAGAIELQSNRAVVGAICGQPSPQTALAWHSSRGAALRIQLRHSHRDGQVSFEVVF